MPWESQELLPKTQEVPAPSEAALQEARFMHSVKAMLGEILSPVSQQLGGLQAEMSELSSDISTLNCHLLDRTRRLESLEARLEEEEEIDPAL